MPSLMCEFNVRCEGKGSFVAIDFDGFLGDVNRYFECDGLAVIP